METGLQLLDCTLRDGGYINDWNWGNTVARRIISALVNARVDVVEVGFLRDVDEFNPDVTVSPDIRGLNTLLPETETHQTMFSAMAMRSNYSIQNLKEYSGTGIEIIRVTAHDYDIKEGLEFARGVKERGYKLSINPINIMGYSDRELLWILEQVNEIAPYQFSIVDTFGSMRRRDLDRIVSLVDNNLQPNIRVALHLHENMAQSFSLAQNFIDKHLKRPVAVDASLLGIGRVPGNLPIELVADYLNNYMGTIYDLDYMMDAIQDYIEPLKGESMWGYKPAYFLSARFNLHRNYAEYYLKKGNLTNRDINHILAGFSEDKKTAFDPVYAQERYNCYQDNRIDDMADRKKLQTQLKDQCILLLAPGKTLVTERERIEKFAAENAPVMISVNFLPEDYAVDYCFFSNNKRYTSPKDTQSKFIVTSNLSEREADFRINFNTLTSAFTQGHNSLVMLLKLLKDLSTEKVFIAGADGYDADHENYYDKIAEIATSDTGKKNAEIAMAIKAIGIQTIFITKTNYTSFMG